MPYLKISAITVKPALLLILLTAYLLHYSGCTPKITNVDLPIDSLQNFTVTGTTAIPSRWWNSFEDPVLNVLIDSALNNNMDLATIWHQFRAAEAVVRRETSFLWPDVEAGAQSALNRPEPDFVGGENLHSVFQQPMKSIFGAGSGRVSRLKSTELRPV